MHGSIDHVRWSTTEFPSRERYDAWVAALNETYGHWNAEFPIGADFNARVKASKLPGLSLVECHCDPCGASRSRADTSTIESEQLTIQLVLAGKEYMKLGSHETTISRGDVFVWDNTQPMQFSVLEPLHKLSLVVPLDRLKNWVPNGWRDLPRHLKSGEPNAWLLGSYVRSLSQIDFDKSPMRSNALIEAAIAILVAPLAPRESESSHRLAQLETVKAKIEPMLRDPGLDLETIAARNCISLRYLHWLFEGGGTTPWRYVVQKRLEGCKRDLENPEHAHRSVTDIAFSWGFSNSAHFARKIKTAYGLSPTELRRMALGVN
ncbi:helix-turn-helix domain-containing protein [Altererythrobacter sp. BO-6]|uniref:helix-turn-helix domain-containing protein n=1 Tax=Altererythrobacter sp. BO-6 TaxID=2604537 RepID=UPI0013E1C656|nr:helix-turn-helix domain-containing protein [Altererythrobacter sp. BO-6]QIG53440.1 helix-turn-helix domain-containing protein [Altererythrobacter sp. BO-6]